MVHQNWRWEHWIWASFVDESDYIIYVQLIKEEGQYVLNKLISANKYHDLDKRVSQIVKCLNCRNVSNSPVEVEFIYRHFKVEHNMSNLEHQEALLNNFKKEYSLDSSIVDIVSTYSDPIE